jgi:predicted glycoside hydrolase/deacetylase ChbG (UPF0249 family)
MGGAYVHADDLGATQSVSKDILDCWEAGALDGFSILANGDALSSVRDRLAQLHGPERRPRIAAHLNLSEGKSLLPPETVPLLVGPDGNLRHTFGSLLAFWLRGPRSRRRELLSQIEQEWGAQVDMVKSVSERSVTAVDGHIHVHMLWFLFPIAVRLAAERGIEEIRISREVIYIAGWRDLGARFFWMNLVKNVVLRVMARRARRVASDKGCKSFDALVGILYTGHMTCRAAEAGVGAARRAGAGTVEVLFHPGYAGTDETRRWSHAPGIAAFAESPMRKVEREELMQFSAARSRDAGP